MFDGGVLIGRDPTREVGSDRLEDLTAVLDEFHVSHALASHAKALFYNSEQGNRATLDAASRTGGRLVPMASFNLPGADIGEVMFRRLKDDGFRGLSLFPNWQPWSLRSFSLRRIGDLAARFDLPVQVVVMEAAMMTEAAMALGPTGAPVLMRMIRGGGYNLVAEIEALADAHPNLLFDVSTVTQAGGVEHLARTIGAERLYLASNHPMTWEAAPYFQLYGALLSEPERLMVEDGSLSRLFGLPVPSAPSPRAEAWERLTARPKIDTHWHTGSWNLIETRIDRASQLEDMERFGLRAAVVNSIEALNYDLEAGNADAADFCDQDARVFGLIVVNPYRVQESLEQIEKFRDHPKMIGVKTIQDFYFDEARNPMRLDHRFYDPIFETAARFDLPIMAHIPGMADAARKHSDATFLCAHSTWNYDDLATCPNVYFDIATSTAIRWEADIPGLLKRVGAARVAFSCDCQLMTVPWTLGKLHSAGVAEADMDQMFLKTAPEIFSKMQRAMEN